MKSINWGQKLSSRKFWALVGAFVVSAGYLFGVAEGTLESISALIVNFGAIAVYILSEAKVDAASVEHNEEEEEA